MRKKLYLLLLSLMCIASSFAQTQTNGQYSVKGQVIDSLMNESVPYATLNIVLTANPTQSVKRLACDIDGKFETTLNAPGDYTVQMQSVGKLPAEKKFVLSENKKSIDLGKLSMHEDRKQLGEVTITAQKPLVKVEIDKLTYSMEDDPEAQTNNTLDMLRKVPMVTVDAEDNIQLKGTSNYKIYLNGKPSNMLSSSNASDVLKSMPASTIKNIEVITDPGAKYDAEGVGGIINIITTKNTLQGYTANVRAGVSALGRYNGGGNFSTKIGKFGLTANYNYNHFRNPWNDSESYQETYMNGADSEITTQNGRSKNTGRHQYGSLEASYEIDTLNLISVGANLWRGNHDSHSQLGVIRRQGDDLLYRYNQFSDYKGTYGSIDMNVDFQHSTSKKDELLTFSYRFSNSPNDSEGYTEIKDVEGIYQAYLQSNNNDAYTNEHTGQVDYTTPLPHNQTLEVGVKYILRESDSDSDIRRLNDGETDWHTYRSDEGEFKHTQHIYGAYLGYAVKIKKFAIKAGVRGEGTKLKAEYKRKSEMNFDNDFFNVVPNVTLSYQLGMAQQMRIGYNMRIHRPGIWYLNPYVNDTDPQNVSYGNPELEPDKSHAFNFNYSFFTMKFNLNAGLNYRFVNNSIERYSFVNEDYNGRLESTYANIGKQQHAGFFLYARWAPIPLLSMYVNGGVNYMHIRSENSSNEVLVDASVSGFNGYMYPGMEFNLPKDFRVNLNGGFSTPWIRLQSKGSSHHYHAISLNKSFLDKKLTVGLSCSNPFVKNMKYTNTIDNEFFYSYNKGYYRAQDVRLNVSYRFGTLKDSIKKARRGISNDDTQSGEGGAGGGGGQGQ